MTDNHAHFSEGVWSEYVTQDGMPNAIKRMGNVVRCRDCCHRVAFEQPLNLERVFCDLRRSLYAVEDEGFCAWGKPRSK